MILTLLICYISLFLLSLRLRDNSIVDIFWWVWFFILTLVTFFFSDRLLVHWIVVILIFLWSTRLSLHIGLRKWKEKKEDPRYARWREEWGTGVYFLIRSFLQVYLLQMFLMLIVATPIFLINTSSGIYTDTMSFFFLVGWSFLALIGLTFEYVADRQLSQFLTMKKPGQIYMWGLYQYSRHPNYFWESVFWLGISCIGVPVSVFSLIGGLMITFLLLKVSGVPLLEARYAGRPEWEAYKSKTSIFIPFPPQK